MRITSIIALITLVCSSVMAHNPLSAKFELNASLQEVAILNIYLSQTGLHQAMIKHFKQEDFTTISENDYKKLAVQYLKKNMSIKTDNKLITIGEGGIKLGNHQTDLKFVIEDYPKEVDQLEVHLSAFNENDNHHSVFWWKKIDGKSKVVLSKNNDFRAVLNSDGIEVAISSTSNTSNLYLFAALSFFIISFLIRNKITI